MLTNSHIVFYRSNSRRSISIINVRISDFGSAEYTACTISKGLARTVHASSLYYN